MLYTTINIIYVKQSPIKQCHLERDAFSLKSELGYIIQVIIFISMEYRHNDTINIFRGVNFPFNKIHFLPVQLTLPLLEYPSAH